MCVMLSKERDQGALVEVITYWVFWIIYTRAWMVLHVLPGDAEKTQRKLHAKYGPVVSIVPNELVTSDPDARRRIVSHVYTMTSILQSEKYIDRCIEVWLEKLGEMADRGESFDLWIWTRMYAYDVIGELYFGKMFGFLQAGGDHLGYIDATDDLVSVQFLAGNMPTYVRGLFMLTGILFPKSQKGSSESDSNPKPQRQDELDFVLDNIKMESFGGFFAGSETTALTLSGILYHILRTPSVYTKLTAEIDAAVQSNQLSAHTAYNEAVKLPYLTACINEGIRMHAIIPRHSPLCGCVNPGVIHFDKSVFGEDADVFRPERWIESEAEASRMDRFIMQFGMGSRTCLGENISMCEIYKAIPELLKLYTFEIARDEEMNMTSYWLHKPVAIDVNVHTVDGL
ncbi:cytochrome P450 [Aspergillus undulatus]|uniref:cytochrome P450 n=1 Tax=Aspergillus undulatus TaxID=1810928 RepID=UPI003CCD7545